MDVVGKVFEAAFRDTGRKTCEGTLPVTQDAGVAVPGNKPVGVDGGVLAEERDVRGWRQCANPAREFDPSVHRVE
jgi:hypothetical protein